MYNPFTLEGKKILVTGASSGIGKAIAIESSKMGAKLIITGRNKQRLQETFLMLDGTGHNLIIADLLIKDDLDRLYKETPVINGLVNCAGLTITKPFKFISDVDLRSVMDLNFEIPFKLTRSIIKAKKINNKASIVFISSIDGVKVSHIANSIYSASKGAINGLCKGLALELAPNIRVNTVIPGMIDTNILSGSAITEEQLKTDIKRYPLGRYGKPEEVAYAIIYLLSDASSWITGSNLLIDGGYTLL